MKAEVQGSHKVNSWAEPNLFLQQVENECSKFLWCGINGVLSKFSDKPPNNKMYFKVFTFFFVSIGFLSTLDLFK